MIQDLNENSFNELMITSVSPVLVEFWATWCQPCKAIAPILEEIDTTLSDRLTICKLDVDQNQAVALRYNVISIPTLILYKDGKEVKRVIGAVGKVELLKEFEQLI
jgi:thioredoxin 1